MQTRDDGAVSGGGVDATLTPLLMLPRDGGVSGRLAALAASLATTGVSMSLVIDVVRGQQHQCAGCVLEAKEKSVGATLVPFAVCGDVE
mmetsp:Transcript_27151/g.84103  ORF Transcript_27151/g.84103 Transcript_27151/m.84103 type:complete len:89 (-) Transcript_27151:453-719(-)